MASTDGVTRRSVLALGASAAGAAVLAGPLGPVAGAATRAAGGSAAVAATTGLRRDHWTGQVGRTITVQGRTGNQSATVVAVGDHRGAPRGDAKRFTVELRTALSKADIGGTNPVIIPNRGTATLLITSIDRGTRYRTYQIVVSAA